MPTAFVTGASGFLGRNLVPVLIAEGYTVRALCRSDAAQSRIRGALAAGQESQLQLVHGDLEDMTALQAGMEVGAPVEAPGVQLWRRQERMLGQAAANCSWALGAAS